MLIGASGALLLGGVLLLVLRGRRKAPAKPAAAAAGRASVAESFSGGVFGAAAGEALSSDDEAALIDQLATDPTDLELHLALLRHYHAIGDAEKFEGGANAMYAQVVDAQAPAWVEASIMGRELLPGNPLFEPAMADEGGEFSFDQLDEGTRGSDAGFDLGSAEIEKIDPVPEADPFDFSLDEPTVAKAEIAPVADVRRDADDIFRTAELSVPTLETPSASAPAAADAGFFDGDDAVGTKLDLARAYLDMGDPEGARSMLQEVIAEGSDAQQQEARRLLAEIG
jgi:pilus assembly protein FimV